MITDIAGAQPTRFMLDGLYAWAENIPEGEDAQAYLDARIDRLRLQTRKMEYPDAPNRGAMTLAEFDDWIAAGAIIPATDTEPERVAIKIPFPDAHPADEIFAEFVIDAPNIEQEIDQIADLNTRAVFTQLFASKIKRRKK